MIPVGVPVNEMSDEILIGGYNSLLRAFDMLCKPFDKEIPDEFTLGKHHLRFFMDKGEYIINDINSVHNQLVCRGLKPDRRPSLDLEQFEEHRRNNWSPQPSDYHKVRKRIKRKFNIKVCRSYLHSMI